MVVIGDQNKECVVEIAGKNPINIKSHLKSLHKVVHSELQYKKEKEGRTIKVKANVHGMLQIMFA